MARSMRPDPRRNAPLVANAQPGPSNGPLGRHFNNISTQQTTHSSQRMTIAPITGPKGRSIFGSAPHPVNAANHRLNGTIPVSESLKVDSISKTGQTPQALDDRPVTIAFGPPECPDQNIMPSSMTSKLPKAVLHAIMKSTSKEQSDLGKNGVLICFTSPKWCKNLIRVHQYLESGEYAPWDQEMPLEIVGGFESVRAWDPEWMASAVDIDYVETTDKTHKLFLEELTLYNWACFTHYYALRKHSLEKLQNRFPILAREALALVDFLCPETNDIPADEDMQQFTREAVAKNKKTMVLLPKFRETFQKALRNNLPAILLEEVQHDLVDFLRNEETPSENTQQDPALHPLLDSYTLENLINRGALCKAIQRGYGTLLPAEQDKFGRLLRNEKFRFVKGELLVIRSNCQTFNPSFNVVVENLRGEQGDMLRELLQPLDLYPNNGSPAGNGAVALPDVTQVPTGPRFTRAAPSPKMQIKTEPPRSSLTIRGRSHVRSRSPEDKGRKHRLSRSRSRSGDRRDRRHFSDHCQNPYGRR